MKLKAIILFTTYILFGINSSVQSQSSTITFGSKMNINESISNRKVKGEAMKWIDVNTSPDTWKVKNDLLISTGHPIGVMRSEKQYENFMLHVEWKHIEPGGNSGVFVWCDAKADQKNRLPSGVEVQMLELDWVNINKQNGEPAPIAYVHGELFGAGSVTTVPDNPRGTRSKSIENRCKGKGEWNTYDVVCVDGVIKLSVNGKFVNGIRQASLKKGYLCLESEGAEIHFRNFRVIELPPGVTSAIQTANEIQ
ncbi:MAG: DUF1080 domain-containing protein [Chitinophagaceae bacterium]